MTSLNRLSAQEITAGYANGSLAQWARGPCPALRPTTCRRAQRFGLARQEAAFRRLGLLNS